jgi:hypothetical protein
VATSLEPLVAAGLAVSHFERMTSASAMSSSTRRRNEVYVRVVVCYDDDEAAAPDFEYTDCPVRVRLERRLGDRAVLDVDNYEELPLYTPAYLDNVPQPDHGYRPANRPPLSRRHLGRDVGLPKAADAQRGLFCA